VSSVPVRIKPTVNQSNTTYIHNKSKNSAMFRLKQKVIIRLHSKESKKLILQLQFISLRSQISNPYDSKVSVKRQRIESGTDTKVQQCRYRPGVAQRVPGNEGSQVSWQRHRMVIGLSALSTCRLYRQEIHLALISVRGWVDPRAIVRPKGLCHWKIPMTPSGIETATYRFVA
jgi:hypothetical protein